MASSKMIDQIPSMMRHKGSYVDLGISYGHIEGHADEDITFVMINEALASSQKTVHDAYLYFQAKAKSQDYFKTPLYASRKIKVKALKYDAKKVILRLKLQAESIPEHS